MHEKITKWKDTHETHSHEGKKVKYVKLITQESLVENMLDSAIFINLEDPLQNQFFSWVPIIITLKNVA